MSLEQERTVLVAAVEALHRDGWCRGTWARDRFTHSVKVTWNSTLAGPRCAESLIRYGGYVMNLSADAAIERVLKIVQVGHPEVDIVPQWNDAYVDSANQVEQVFLAAIAQIDYAIRESNVFVAIDAHESQLAA